MLRSLHCVRGARAIQPFAAGFLWMMMLGAGITATGCATTSGAFEKALDGTSEVIDLSYNLHGRMPPGMDLAPFQVAASRSIERDGIAVNRFALSESSGTNIEAPARLVTGAPAVDRIAPAQLFGQGVVIDVTAAVAQNSVYQVTRSDIERWESTHGAIPSESIVIFNTGWASRWDNPEKYVNLNEQGKAAYPGVSAEAVEFLMRERRVHAMGIDTMSIYAGSGDGAGQKSFLMTGRFHINNLTNLSELPAQGAVILAVPLKIQGGTGSPARVLAIIPLKQTAVVPGKKKVEQSNQFGSGGQGGPGGAGGGQPQY